MAELEFVVNELGLKAIVMNTQIHLPHPDVVKEAPHLAQFSTAPISPAIDVGDRYDKVWARCVELEVAPSCHNSSRGRGSLNNSPTNYVHNSLGSFAKGSEFFAVRCSWAAYQNGSLTLKYAFLEGGPGWAAALYNSLFEYFEKRNLDALKRNLDPANSIST